MTTDAIALLQDRLGRYPAERYPVQHATTQFHLGQALLQAGRFEGAAAALQRSLWCFPEAMAVERAKVHNLIGAAQRSLGDLVAATAAFEEAATVFAVHGLLAEDGAARFNLGLLRRDAGDPVAAIGFFEQARSRFADGPPAPKAMVSLHLGTALLEAGEVDAALVTLEGAVELAERLADREGLGAAANALGLAHLAAGRPDGAAAAFARAVAAHPRTVRPAAFAMAKANLALAHEAVGSYAHARLAAHQALSVQAAPDPVVAQARAVIDRAGAAGDSDLLAVLDDAPEAQRLAVVREEVMRWASLPTAARRTEAAAFIAGVATRPWVAEHVVHAWLSAMLELPPADLDALITAVVHAADDVDDAAAVEHFRARTDRVMARFPVPQLLRLRDRVDQVAAGLGQEAAWNRCRT